MGKSGTLAAKRDTRATQRRIVDAAQVEFTNAGYDGARIDQIASRAAVSRQLVYCYYGSKKGLYAAVLDEQALLAHRLLSEIDFFDSPPLTVLRRFVEVVFDHQLEASAKMTIDTALHDSAWLGSSGKVHLTTGIFLDKVSAVIARGKKEGVVASGADAHDFYAMTTVVVTGSIALGNLLSKMLKRDYHSRQAMDFWRRYTADVMVRSVASGIVATGTPPLDTMLS
jgi:AcrR family transcriptional regulator